MAPVERVIRDYLGGQVELEVAARRLLELCQDKESGGWGLYLDERGVRPEDLVRARALEARFNELVEQHLPKRGAGGTAEHALEADGAVLLGRPSVCEIVHVAPQLKCISLGGNKDLSPSCHPTAIVSLAPPQSWALIIESSSAEAE